MAKKSKKKGSSKKKKSKAVRAASSKKVRKVSHKGARKKGLNFERWIANEIGHVYPEAKRHLEYQADEAQKGKDISNTGPYAIQAKNHQNYCSIKTIKEVARTEENRPILVTKGNKMEPVVVMYFSDWVKMLEEIRGREEYENTIRTASASPKEIEAPKTGICQFVDEVAAPPSKAEVELEELGGANQFI